MVHWLFVPVVIEVFENVAQIKRILIGEHAGGIVHQHNLVADMLPQGAEEVGIVLDATPGVELDRFVTAA